MGFEKVNNWKIQDGKFGVHFYLLNTFKNELHYSSDTVWFRIRRIYS